MLSYEKIYRGMKNKKYLLMCGISQFSNLPVVGGIFFVINKLILLLCTLVWKTPGMGSMSEGCVPHYLLPEVMHFV